MDMMDNSLLYSCFLVTLSCDKKKFGLSFLLQNQNLLVSLDYRCNLPATPYVSPTFSSFPIGSPPPTNSLFPLRVAALVMG